MAHGCLWEITNSFYTKLYSEGIYVTLSPCLSRSHQQYSFSKNTGKAYIMQYHLLAKGRPPRPQASLPHHQIRNLTLEKVCSSKLTQFKHSKKFIIISFPCLVSPICGNVTKKLSPDFANSRRVSVFAVQLIILQYIYILN